jgi:hypothetical protein
LVGITATVTAAKLPLLRPNSEGQSGRLRSPDSEPPTRPSGVRRRRQT